MLRTVSLYLLAIFWIFAGSMHFRNPDFYLKMMPLWMPWHYELVILSGVTEVLAGLMVLWPRTRRLGGLFILAHLAVFMLVHIDMLIYAEERFAHLPLLALWLRLPAQGLLAFWAWTCTLQNTESVHD